MHMSSFDVDLQLHVTHVTRVSNQRKDIFFYPETDHEVALAVVYRLILLVFLMFTKPTSLICKDYDSSSSLSLFMAFGQFRGQIHANHSTY